MTKIVGEFHPKYVVRTTPDLKVIIFGRDLTEDEARASLHPSEAHYVAGSILTEEVNLHLFRDESHPQKKENH